MTKAKDIMEKNIISLSPDTEISKAVEILLKNHINGVPVVDDNGELLGILCQSDLIFQFLKRMVFNFPLFSRCARDPHGLHCRPRTLCCQF